MQDVAEAERFVTAMRALGCRVALDDFGAGYTSFRHLKALSVDIVKIDGSYVQGLPVNTDNQLFVRTLLALCNGFGLKTVAEFVETQAEADLLRAYGIGLLQGYHCGKPQLDRPWMRDLPGFRAVGD
jgi:EAL domain-containing protein (putative c-di-GMP-specific phosphodiesterase class I)